MSTYRLRAPHRGFTLMEMLVVLVLVALATTLMFEALGSFRQANERVAARTAAVRENALALSWLQDSLAAMRPEQDHPFKGEREQLSGLSLAPLGGPQGAPARITWSLQSQSLTYAQETAEPGLVLAVAGLRGFAYLDAEGKAHDQWPPSKGLYPELPEAIALVFNDGRGDDYLRPVLITGPKHWLPAPYEREPD